MLFKEAVRLLKIERSDKIIYNNKKKKNWDKKYDFVLSVPNIHGVCSL